MLQCSGFVFKSDVVRVVWSFWDKGAENLSEFRQLCIETWRLCLPGHVSCCSQNLDEPLMPVLRFGFAAS